MLRVFLSLDSVKQRKPALTNFPHHGKFLHLSNSEGGERSNSTTGSLISSHRLCAHKADVCQMSLIRTDGVMGVIVRL